MKGFTKVPFCQMAEGDLLVLPASARALHSSPKTLSRHGLSNGFSQSRSDNLDALVYETMSAKPGEPAKDSAFWVWTVTSGEKPPEKGSNSLTALVPKKTVTGMRLVPARGRLLLPKRIPRSSFDSPSIWPVRGLLDAVKRRFKERPAGMEAEYRYGTDTRSRGWAALRALADMLPDKACSLDSVPPSPTLVARTPPEWALWRRVFAERPGGVYNGWMTPGWGEQLRVYERFSKFLEDNGAEVWRPAAKTLDAMADRVLLEHAKRCAEELKRASRLLRGAWKKAAGELEELEACGLWWEARVSELSERKAKDGKEDT